MKLSDDQVKELLKSPNLQTQIERGKKYESRLRVFTEPKSKEEIKNEHGWKEVINFLDDIFTEKRSEKIKQFIAFPLASIDITEGILADLYKVFNARNTFFDFELPKNKGGDKLTETINTIEPVKWIEKVGREVLKNKPNTVVAIDKLEDGTPYLLEINNDRLIDCMVNGDSTLEYISFIHSIENYGKDDEIKRVAFYDAFAYRIFLEAKDGEYTLESDISHTAGVCPARMFISDRLNSKDSFNRKIPFSSTLSKIREWQLFDFYKFYGDHYVPFPIIEKVKDVCDYDGCDNGIITETSEYIEDGVPVFRDKHVNCPSCIDKQIMGPGIVVEIPAKDTKDDPDSAGVFRMITPDTSSMTYLQNKSDDIEKSIRFKTVGIDNTINKEAVNELQVKGSFESRENVLLKIKSNLDELYRWMVTTVAKLQSGADVEVKVSANFGTEFYLLTELELQERYEKAKKIGLPIEEVDMIYEQLIATKYRGNPSKVSRLELIKLLDPLPHETMDVAQLRHESGLITEQEYFLKGRLISFIDRFEREQAPLVQFGKEQELNLRINNIRNILNNYSDEYIKAKPTRDSQEATGKGEDT